MTKIRKNRSKMQKNYVFTMVLKMVVIKKHIKTQCFW